MPKIILSSYAHRDSYFHKLHPLTKFVITGCAIVLAFVVKSFIFNLLLAALIIPIGYKSKILSQVFRPVRYLFIIFVILFGIQSFFYPFSVTPLMELPFGITIWLEGVLYAANISARLLVMLVFGYWFVLTTHPGDLVSEFKERGLPHWMGYIIITTLQLIPRIQSQMSVIIEAQKSRGLDTRGSLVNRLKAYTPLLGPLFIGSVQQAVERSMALEARAFSAKCPKTSFRDRRFKTKDSWWTIGFIVFSVLYGVLSWLL